MWRETNLFGILLPPLLVYALAALVLFVPLRFVLLRLRLLNRLPAPALAQFSLYLCLLAALVSWV